MLVSPKSVVEKECQREPRSNEGGIIRIEVALQILHMLNFVPAILLLENNETKPYFEDS